MRNEGNWFLPTRQPSSNRHEYTNFADLGAIRVIVQRSFLSAIIRGWHTFPSFDQSPWQPLRGSVDYYPAEATPALRILLVSPLTAQRWSFKGIEEMTAFLEYELQEDRLGDSLNSTQKT